ncbi:MAG: hypothetical protein Q8K99_09860 [Actinomycetota bacterium]|nr:hypothetical protein [Actinomycetota bacterium]
MSTETTVAKWIEIIRRHWWVVAVVAVVAAGVAFAVGSSETITYQAKATVRVDNVSIASYARLPKPDEVMSLAKTAELAEKVAAVVGEDAATVKSGLNAFTSGNPQDKVVVTFTGPEQDTAKEIVDAAATEVVAAENELARPEYERLQALIDSSEEAIVQLEKHSLPGQTSAASAWNIERAMQTDQAALDFMKTAYTYPGEPSVSKTAVGSSAAKNVAAGGLLGLFIGVVLAGLRERMRRPRAGAAG